MRSVACGAHLPSPPSPFSRLQSAWARRRACSASCATFSLRRHRTSPRRIMCSACIRCFPRDDANGEPHIGNRTSFPFYELVVNRSKSFDSVAAYTDARLAVGTGPDARMARATLVSGGFWNALGPRPALGRFFQDAEAHPATGSRVVVLGHAFWQRQFGGRRDVVGSTLSVKGQPYDIIGVAPRGFRGIELADVDLWLPLFARGDGSDEHSKWHTSATSSNVTLVARLKDDVAAERGVRGAQHALFGVSCGGLRPEDVCGCRTKRCIRRKKPSRARASRTRHWGTWERSSADRRSARHQVARGHRHSPAGDRVLKRCRASAAARGRATSRDCPEARARCQPHPAHASATH